jgi:hydroxycarboxylate dehydrogenase B
MKYLTPERLTTILASILAAAGTPADIAQLVAASLADSNLKGVDSHGAIRVTMYVDQILSGYMQAAARPEIVHETPTTARIHGHSGLGIYTLGYALEVALQKAHTHQVAAVGLTGSTHTGRIGQYAEAAAAQGCFALITGGGASQHPEKHASVTPYGGRGRILATNPYALGLPGGAYGPVVVDTSTSMTAEGKLRLYRDLNQPVPDGWILDRDGQPTNSAHDFYAGGVILPAAGHKGYGLALMAELLGSALLGESQELNWFIVALNIEAFRSLNEFNTLGEQVLGKVKAVPPMAGVSEVLLPGEPEARMAAERQAQGVPLPPEVWAQIVATAARVGVALEAE